MRNPFPGDCVFTVSTVQVRGHPSKLTNNMAKPAKLAKVDIYTCFTHRGNPQTRSKRRSWSQALSSTTACADY